MATNASLRPRALLVGTFDPRHTRNRVVPALLARAGWDTSELRGDLWAADRFGAIGRGRVRLAIRALRVYARLIIRSALAPRPDVVVVLYPGHFDMLLLAPVWRLRRVPIVFDPLLSLHDTVVTDRELAPKGSMTAWFTARIDRLAFRRADVLLVDTPQVGAHYEQQISVRPERMVVIWPGTDAVELGPRTVPVNTNRVVFYGTYIPLHGIDTIVRAAAQLADTPLEFRLIGTGQERAAIEALIHELGGVPHLELVEPMSLGELGDEIRAATICLGIFGTTDKASRVVPFKVFEYLALARPVITAATPAAIAALGDVAVLVPPGDPTALADALRSLAADPERRAQLAADGAQRYDERFSELALAAALGTALAKLPRRATAHERSGTP